MFYSHEVLNSRKYGVATVWLVATLGSKSTLKKVSRKAILDVDVQKACNTIVTPEAPMALRLQSNLLYGVSRVYLQQCGYVLSDAETARNNLRLMFKVMRSSVLDAEEETKARADQLMIPDDPNYVPDLNPGPPAFEDLNLDDIIANVSQHSILTLSHTSSRHSGEGASLGSKQEIGGIDIPHSAGSIGWGSVGSFGMSETRGFSRPGIRPEPAVMLQDADDLGLIISDGEDGPIGTAQNRGSSANELRGQNVQPADQVSAIRPNREGFRPGENAVVQQHDNSHIILQDDDIWMQETERLRSDEELPHYLTTMATAEALMHSRASRAPRNLPFDSVMELRNSELASWSANYIANMKLAMRSKTTASMAALARRNAEIWMLGELGKGNRGPLSMFSGQQLLEALTGVDLRGSKREREDMNMDTGRRVRPRSSSKSNEIFRGLDDDEDYLAMVGDDTIEQGRAAGTPLVERQRHSIMPWNQSEGSRAHLLESAFPTSHSIGGGATLPGSLGRRASRLVSASPLLGRGVGSDRIMDEIQLPSGSHGDFGMSGDDDDFELFAAADQVDTQTQSQRLRSALDSESMQFLGFVQSRIHERSNARKTGGNVDAEARDDIDISFEHLLSPYEHSQVVAAQALMHVLSLATKDVLTVEQKEAFGSINIIPKALASPANL